MDHLSASQMNLYFQCSLKYKFQYIDKLPKPFKASGLVFGSAIHSAISWFHKNQLAGRQVPLEKLYSIFSADWYGQKVESLIRYRETETETSLILLGKEMLNLYYHQPRAQVKGTEIPFAVPLVSPGNGDHLGINLEGYIDLLEENDSIVEFKTSVKTMDLKDVNLQLTAYSYAYEMLYGKRPRNLRVVNFLKLKKPKMLSLEVKQGTIDHKRFFFLAKEALKGIRSGVFFPRHSWWCDGCEYTKPCREWNGA
ncbi:MAG: PD-(D/E)XK nuclease family protein [Syntrophobacteraceae bacterium]